MSEYLSEKQWAYVTKKFPDTTKARVVIDIGFIVTTKHNVEDEKANVDYGVYSPKNVLLKNENGVTEGEVEITTTADAKGPWKICYRVSGGKLLKPSVIVDLAYFQVNFDEYIDDTFEWEEESTQKLSHGEIGTHDQVVSIEMGLNRIDRYIENVTNEQRFLYARTVRHLKTAQSTLSRTYYYYFAIYFAIILASVSQVLVIRMMFKKVRLSISVVEHMVPPGWYLNRLRPLLMQSQKKGVLML